MRSLPFIIALLLVTVPVKANNFSFDKAAQGILDREKAREERIEAEVKSRIDKKDQLRREHEFILDKNRLAILRIETILMEGMSALRSTCCLAMGLCEFWSTLNKESWKDNFHPLLLGSKDFGADTQRRYCVQYGLNTSGIQGSLDCVLCSGEWMFRNRRFESDHGEIVGFTIRTEDGLLASWNRSSLKVSQPGSSYYVSYSINNTGQKFTVFAAELPASVNRNFLSASGGQLTLKEIFGILDEIYQADPLDPFKFASMLIQEPGRADQLILKHFDSGKARQ